MPKLEAKYEDRCWHKGSIHKKVVPSKQLESNQSKRRLPNERFTPKRIWREGRSPCYVKVSRTPNLEKGHGGSNDGDENQVPQSYLHERIFLASGAMSPLSPL